MATRPVAAFIVAGAGSVEQDLVVLDQGLTVAVLVVDSHDCLVERLLAHRA